MAKTFTFTDEEALVALNLMQAGVRAQVGDAFDQASASYLHLKNKMVEARKAGSLPEAVVAEVVADDAPLAEAAE